MEDEAEIRGILAAYFVREGWKVDMTSNGIEAFQMYDYKKHDLIILDLKLEGLPGERVCELIREKSKVPVIFLTSKSMETDIINGFNLGADDYVVKPFRVKELVARIKAISRRAAINCEEKLVLLSFDNGSLVVNCSTSEVSVNGQPVQLTTTEFKLLSVLISEPMKVFSRSKLMYQVMGYRFQEDGRSLDVHVKNLRKKIEKDTKNPDYVKTVIGMGYKFAFQADKE
ncbi:response regulator transcription factor [Paenibacillus ferrarius]|uniref:response regulator transcription factor n=1 Tax=Paenibacillus ferrarius TaxID=1469647 RepID=UPI003D2682C0